MLNIGYNTSFLKQLPTHFLGRGRFVLTPYEVDQFNERIDTFSKTQDTRQIDYSQQNSTKDMGETGTRFRRYDVSAPGGLGKRAFDIEYYDEQPNTKGETHVYHFDTNGSLQYVEETVVRYRPFLTQNDLAAAKNLLHEALNKFPQEAEAQKTSQSSRRNVNPAP